MSEHSAKIVAAAAVADSFAEFIAACADHCRCCPQCIGTPCDGCCAGGVCDAFRCTCDDEWSDPDDWDDPEAIEWDHPEMDFNP